MISNDQRTNKQWRIGPDNSPTMDLKSCMYTEFFFIWRGNILKKMVPEIGERFYSECSRPFQRLSKLISMSQLLENIWFREKSWQVFWIHTI